MFSEAIEDLKKAYDIANRNELTKNKTKYSESIAYFLLEAALKSKSTFLTQKYEEYLKEATDWVNKSLEHSDNKYSPALNIKARIFEEEGNLEEAQHLYKESIKNNPDNNKARNNLRNLLTKQGRHEEASTYEEKTKTITFYNIAENELVKLQKEKSAEIERIEAIEVEIMTLDKRVTNLETSEKILSDRINLLEDESNNPILEQVTKEKEEANRCKHEIDRFKQPGNEDLRDFYCQMVATLEANYIAGLAIESGEIAMTKKDRFLSKGVRYASEFALFIPLCGSLVKSILGTAADAINIPSDVARMQDLENLTHFTSLVSFDQMAIRIAVEYTLAQETELLKLDRKIIDHHTWKNYLKAAVGKSISLDDDTIKDSIKKFGALEASKAKDAATDLALSAAGGMVAGLITNYCKKPISKAEMLGRICGNTVIAILKDKQTQQKIYQDSIALQQSGISEVEAHAKAVTQTSQPTSNPSPMPNAQAIAQQHKTNCVIQ